jgi:hypothetical protein
MLVELRKEILGQVSLDVRYRILRCGLLQNYGFGGPLPSQGSDKHGNFGFQQNLGTKNAQWVTGAVRRLSMPPSRTTLR